MRVRKESSRSRVFFAWAAVRWLLLMFVTAPMVQAPALAKPVEPPKPIRVWKAKASWYGPRFEGRRTAFGEVFDMYAPTAAHSYLPYGSVLRVTYPRTHRSRLVRINDRGPFVPGRELDLSFQMASELGFAENGIAVVQIELLEVPKGKWPLRRAAD